MIHIDKGPEPRELVQHRASSRAASYGDFRELDALRVALVRDQGHLCAYCTQRISATPSGMKIEHWYPQHPTAVEPGASSPKPMPRGPLDFRNLLGVCTGGQHRSVYVVEWLAQRFEPRHVDLLRGLQLLLGIKASIHTGAEVGQRASHRATPRGSACPSDSLRPVYRLRPRPTSNAAGAPPGPPGAASAAQALAQAPGSRLLRISADYPDPQNFILQQLHTGSPNNNFGEITAGQIAGRVWADDNNNAVVDSGEAGLAGVGGVNVPPRRIAAFVRDALDSEPSAASLWVR